MFWEVGLPTDPWAFGGPIWLFEGLEGDADQHPDKAQLPFSSSPVVVGHQDRFATFGLVIAMLTRIIVLFSLVLGTAADGNAASDIRLMCNGYHLMNARTDGVTLAEREWH